MQCRPTTIGVKKSENGKMTTIPSTCSDLCKCLFQNWRYIYIHTHIHSLNKFEFAHWTECAIHCSSMRKTEEWAKYIWNGSCPAKTGFISTIYKYKPIQRNNIYPVFNISKKREKKHTQMHALQIVVGFSVSRAFCATNRDRGFFASPLLQIHYYVNS